MIRVIFLLPIVLCILWYWFLVNQGIPIKKGKKGFIYILTFSVFVLGFFVLMMWVTQVR